MVMAASRYAAISHYMGLGFIQEWVMDSSKPHIDSWKWREISPSSTITIYKPQIKFNTGMVSGVACEIIRAQACNELEAAETP